MKVVEIINGLAGKGGAEVFFVQLCAELLRNSEISLRIVIIAADIHPDFQKFLDDNSRIVLLLNKTKKVDFSAAKKLRDFLGNYSPDIINMHLSCLPIYLLAMGFRKKSWRIVQTIHNLYKKDASLLGRFLRRPLIANDMISFIGISPLISSDIQKNEPQARCHTICNGINLPSINEKLFVEKKFDIICVARFFPQKNHELLFSALSLIKKKMPNVRLLLLGDGVLRQKLKDTVRELGLNDNVIFAGCKSDVYPYLCQSKVFALTSDFEGNPISILEAMVVGLPIVASFVGGIPDIVEDGRNGFLFPPGDAEKCAKNLLRLLSNPRLSNDISAQNRLDSRKFSVNECAQRYYECFLAEKKKSLRND